MVIQRSIQSSQNVIRFSVCCLAGYFACFAGVGPANSQDAKAKSASIEQLTAMLHSIDPYRPNSQATGTVRVFGSTSMDAMAHGWTTGFKKFHKSVDVEIAAAGSEAVFTKLLESPSAVGMLSRPVKDAELEALRKKGVKKPVAFVVAREALGVFVHPSNPVKTISAAQLRDVFTTSSAGSAKQNLNWGMLGATGELANKPIRVISRTETSGTQKFLKEFVFNNTEMRKGVSAHVSNAQVLAEVAKDPYSIAICGLRSNLKSVKPLQLMSGASVVPSDDHAILMGQYPLTRPLTMLLDVSRTDADAKAAQEFVHYALCQAGQAEAILVGFFPVDLPLLRAGLQKLGATQLR